MPRRDFARLSAILLIVAALTAPPAWGASRWPPGEVSPLDLFARIWGSLAAIWSAEGCAIDPHGGCGPSQPPRTDEGCSGDPHGGCGTAQGEAPAPPTTDSGCNADPHGGCRAEG